MDSVGLSQRYFRSISTFIAFISIQLVLVYVLLISLSLLFLSPSVFLVCLSVLLVSYLVYTTVLDKYSFFLFGAAAPVGQGFLFPGVSGSHTSVGRTPLDE